MMIKFLPVLLTVLLLCGCGHTPLREIHPAALPPPELRADDAVAQERADKLSDVLSQLNVRGIAVYPQAFFGRFDIDEMQDAMAHCNTNRIYCCITSEQELNETLKKFIIDVRERGFEVEIVVSQQDFYRQYQVNNVIRKAMIQFPKLPDVVRMIVAFDRTLPETSRLNGITVCITPHLYNGSNVRRMYGCLYRWSDRSYGKGRDNDMIMIQTYDMLKEIAAIDNLPQLTIAIPDFLHQRAKKGELSVGTVKDFCAITPNVAVISSANLPSKVAGKVAHELADAPEDSCIMAVIPLAEHVSIKSGRLRRRNWDDFIRTIEYTGKELQKSPAFGGLILSPLSVIEYLRLEK